METKTFTVTVSGSIGAVSCIMIRPSPMKAMIVLAHGAGAGMNHSFMELLANRLAGSGIGTLRFNFPFMEQRKKRPDVPAVAEKTVAAVITAAKQQAGAVPLYAAGKSFGGRMTSQYLSKADPSPVQGVVFYGFPLHPPGAPATTRASHLGTVKTPMLFLQGTRDALADLSLIREVCAKLKLAKLVTFEGADHSFKSGKKEFMTELVDATDTWIGSALGA